MDSTDLKGSKKSLYEFFSEIPPMSFIRRFNRAGSAVPLVIVTVIYTALIIWISVFHELWFDEAQAWTIAKDASLFDILFKIPHFETHPPLWHLILCIPAKAGLPYELSMKVIQILTAVFMIVVVEFKSPLPNIIKVILPFTYWTAYQYGIISRPYALFAALLFICASLYMERDRKPVLYCVILGLLCLTSLYGVIIAAMIAAAWIFKLMTGYKGQFVKKFFAEDRARLISLAVLLVFGICVVLAVWPKSDTAGMLASGMNAGKLMRGLLNAVLVMPSETFLSTDLYPNVLISSITIETTALVLMSVRSLIVLAVIFALPFRKKRLTDCLLPVAGFMAIAALYSMAHHFGLFFILAVYCFWIGLYGSEKKEEQDTPQLAGFVTAGFIYLLAMPFIWTIMSARGEIINNYDYGKDTAAWITENSLQDYNWLSAWQPVDLTYSSYNISLTTSAYLGRPVNYNLHGGLSYCIRDTGDYEAALKEAKELQKYGAPDFIIANRRSQFKADLTAVGVSGDYELVCVTTGGNIDRGRCYRSVLGIWMNRDNKKLPSVKAQTEVPEGFVLED